MPSWELYTELRMWIEIMYVRYGVLLLWSEEAVRLILAAFLIFFGWFEVTAHLIYKKLQKIFKGKISKWIRDFYKTLSLQYLIHFISVYEWQK